MELITRPEKQQIAGQIELLVEEILAVDTPASAKRPLERGTDYLEDPKSSLKGGGNEVDGGINTTSLENQIDELVFELYGLTSEEISVIKK